MANNGRLYVATNISADTGELGVPGLSGPPPHPAQGTSEQIVNFRLKLKTNTVDALGTMLVSVRYNDGDADQAWQVALNTTAGNYAETSQQIWCDASRNVTIQTEPLAGSGSVDVLLLGAF